MKKIISIACSAVLAFTSLALTACGGGGDDDGKTKVYVELKSGGTGVQWLVDAGKRFSDLNENTVYEEGKVGVAIVPVPSDNPSIKNAETSGSAIFDLMEQPIIENDARAGKVLKIDDVFTDKSDMRNGVAISPLEKIPQDQLSRYMFDGHYYGAPTCEYYPSISYDKNLFDRYHLYLCNPETIEDESNEGVIVAFDSDITGETYYFLPTSGENEDMKSCGPDGVYETEDDGLPSSLYEFIALCEYMKSDYGVNPFNFPGNYKYYSNFLCSALYTALQGYDRARANYTFNGEIEIVTGFEDEYLFNSVGEIKKPITKTIQLTEENGYYTTWGVEKYYAEAFMQLCVNQGWFGPAATSGADQKSSMQNFVFSDHNGAAKIAFLLDGSYWYNEATEEDNYFSMWEKSNYLIAGMHAERDVRVMPLPVNIEETVEEGEGKPQTLLEMNAGMLVINKNVESNPGLMRACKEFLKFLYTDKELSAYTAGTSILRSMNYELNGDDKTKISSFGQHLIDMINTEGNKVVYFVAENQTFKANMLSFRQSWTNAVFGVSNIAPSLYEALAIQKVDGFKTVHDIFSKQALNKTSWAAMYQGSLSVTDVDGLTSLV